MMQKKQFLDEVVNGWMKNDLVRMRDDIRPDDSEVGNINFPLALCSLSYMEYLGGFLIGKHINFLENVKKYIETCFKKPEEYPVEILKELIRNGLSHEYFPRGAICRNGLRPPIHKGNNYSIVLDAETLTNDFISSLEQYVTKLQESTYNARMREALDTIERCKYKHKNYIDKLRLQPIIDTVTPSSGPSGYLESLNTTTLDPSFPND